MEDKFDIYNKKIIDNLYRRKTIYRRTNIDIGFNNPINQVEERYTLLNEENELLLINQNIFQKEKENNQNNLKIKELFKGEENENYYYINKEELKEKYLKNYFELNKNSNDITIDNENEEKMNKLYEEKEMMHPRKLVNGEIKKYSFCSWLGFFYLKNAKLEKSAFFNLGFGITSYFKTIKLFILFFSIISFINVIGIIYYSSYKTIKAKEVISGNLLKTTLYNTKITTYNEIIIPVDSRYNRNIDISLNCGDKSIGKIIYGFKSENLDKNTLEKIKSFTLFEEDISELPINPSIFKILPYDADTSSLSYYELSKCNEIISSNCFLSNTCTYNFNCLDNWYYGDSVYILYYECINESLLPSEKSENRLMIITQIITITTLIILLVLYYYYKGAINYESENYYKNKIFINNYTLVLNNLKIISDNYNIELNDLIYHLNKIISNEIETDNVYNIIEDNESLNNSINNFKSNKNKDKYVYIFDIVISNVNERKIEIIENIKEIQNTITDIRQDNDSIKKKIKNSFNLLYKNFKQEQNKDLNDSLLEKGKEDYPSSLLPSETENDDNISDEQKEKLENRKDDLKEQIIKINDINELHFEYLYRNYVDIYITFKNPLFAYTIYKKYKKSKFKRFLLYLFCQCNKIKKYYYKKQWLNFQLSNNAPSNIQWENCYIPTKIKIKSRCISFLVSFLIIIIATVIIILLKQLNIQYIVNLIITLIIQIIHILSAIILTKITKSEKYSTLTKNISSNIKKYFILNFILAGISINITCHFTYKNFDKYSDVIKCIILSMFLSIFTSHSSAVFIYIWNFFLKYLDSKSNNGKTTKIKNRLKYENLYIGPEFPIGERYSSILVNLAICLLYGTFCPIIYAFFTLFLITTFLVDKYLIINYYKKPPNYDNYLSKKTKGFLFFEIMIFFYGVTYHISNPYLFNYYQNKYYSKSESLVILCCFINPVLLIYKFIIGILNYHMTIIYYNVSSLCWPYFILLVTFLIVPFLFLKCCKICKKKEKISLKYAPNIDIGNIYSSNEIKKYYEIKKLELFKLLINANKNNEKINDNYSHLINNYKNVIDYLKEININHNHIDNKYVIDNSKNNDSNTNDGDINEEENEDRLLIGDTSYNLAFIPNYEIYSYFDLLYYI